jgi:hypothetical protein
MREVEAEILDKVLRSVIGAYRQTDGLAYIVASLEPSRRAPAPPLPRSGNNPGFMPRFMPETELVLLETVSKKYQSRLRHKSSRINRGDNSNKFLVLIGLGLLRVCKVSQGG